MLARSRKLRQARSHSIGWHLVATASHLSQHGQPADMCRNMMEGIRYNPSSTMFILREYNGKRQNPRLLRTINYQVVSLATKHCKAGVPINRVIEG